MPAILGIGTAQFGMKYGISNKDGQTPAHEVKNILTLAAQNGIRTLDTAHAYGSSEEALGCALEEGHPFSIVTKTPVAAGADPGAGLEQSLSRLKQKSIDGLLVHDPARLLSPEGPGLFKKLQEYKNRRLVKKIGVSVYTGGEIDRILDVYPIDLIQLPASIFDQRLIRSGHLAKLKKAGIEVHARSIFLQGLIFIPPSNLPAHFAPAKNTLLSFHEFLEKNNMAPAHAAISFICGITGIDAAICGVNNHLQLQELCLFYKERLTHPGLADFAIDDKRIVNPSFWKGGL
ncbi:MAG: hypothetical protein A2583_14295 [Bdellovibrionales bacterium RIFOXYD1_FULL_53_11]|nr:MAG: hypothetical protein A2583_14295 [Bdellovibrionales bacterium RIFOXYD1_FULL_53_11]